MYNHDGIYLNCRKYDSNEIKPTNGNSQWYCTNVEHESDQRNVGELKMGWIRALEDSKSYEEAESKIFGLRPRMKYEGRGTVNEKVTKLDDVNMCVQLSWVQPIDGNIKN